MKRRQWLQAIMGLGAAIRARLGLAFAPKAADAAVYVPSWQGPLGKHRVQPVVATAGRMPVYGFGDVDILAESPDLFPGEILQQGNTSPVAKIRHKKSWEIRANKIGTTPPRTPRTYMMDFKPLRAIHLIDGDPETYWASRGVTRPDVQPQWIRLDLPREARVRAVVLQPRQDNQGWPGDLVIKVSRDAWHWETVYEKHDFQPPAKVEPQTFSFDPRPVKQLWIIGNNLRWAVAENFLMFSLAGVQVLDEHGNDLALATRGTGVTVSSTNHGAAGEKTIHDMLWPAHYDLGLKWMRVAYWDSVLNWHYAEQEKGKIVIDPLADQTMTECADNGINVVLVLAYGNWLYSRQGRRAHEKQIWVVPFEWPPPPTDTDEHFEAWLRFVRTMVRHFKGRIRYYEIWNEQNGNWNAERHTSSKTDEAISEYCRLVKETARVIREEYREAKVMLGSTSGFDSAYMTACLKQGVGPLLDVIPWHPFYGTQQDQPQFRSYRQDVRAWKKVCESYGFRGEYMATESGYYAPYPPPAKPFGGGANTEIAKAKYLARYITMSVGLDLTTFWNTTWHHYAWWDLGLFRNTFSADPVSPTQPQPAYYVLRTLCTLLESALPANVRPEFSNTAAEFEVDSFELPGNRMLVGIWIPGKALDEPRHAVTDLRFPQLKWKGAVGIDTLNGSEQRLNASGDRLQGIVVKDYPIFIRLELA
jgi:hypothetical protein